MNTSSESKSRPTQGRAFSTYSVLIVAASLVAIVATFLLANSSFEVGFKTRGFSAIIAAFLAVCTLFYFWQSRRSGAESPALDEFSDGNIDDQLGSLDEANDFFAGALRASDAFRLIASRVKGLVPFVSIELLLLDKTRSHFTVNDVVGQNAEDRKGIGVGFDEGIAGRSFRSQIVEFGNEPLLTDDNLLPTAAIPLLHDADVFGVLRLQFDPSYVPTSLDRAVFEAIGVRAAPLMLSSIAFERSESNALTDVTTELPNERAFYLVLENQIAEATRKRDDRPLTILTIDVKEFDDINRRFGHAAGDRVLNFVAQTVKDNLRQMDFFARSISDEFLAILPTASQEVSHEVIARIHTGFFGRKLTLTESESVEIQLNVGWAAFGADGETSDQLLGIARLRKEQMKSVQPKKVLWFPQELSN